jgi:hypothetical protein
MAKVTYFVAQPFELSKRGRFTPGAAQPARSADQAVRTAERLAKTKGGAVAFSRSGDPEFGEFDDAVILARYGEVPDDLLFG